MSLVLQAPRDGTKVVPTVSPFVFSRRIILGQCRWRSAPNAEASVAGATLVETGVALVETR